MEQYKVVDLFAGAGGLSLGFAQTGRFSIVAAAENNPDARKTYKRNHKNTRLYADVRTIDYDEITESFGNIDVVIGGPPCQGFSNANRQHSTIISMNNRLVKEYVRAICELKPRVFVMENVAMLRSNLHRFIVDEDDFANPTVMSLPLSEDNIELLPAGVDIPNILDFVRDTTNIETFSWDEKLFKVITILYRYRINQPKFNKTIEKYSKYLLKVLETYFDLVIDEATSIITVAEKEMASALLEYMKDSSCDFDNLIELIEPTIFTQRMLRKMSELRENNIHVFEYKLAESGAVTAHVRSYSVLDYIHGILETAPNDYKLKPMVLNAVEFGAPQKRERFIIVGVSNSLKKEYEQPSPKFEVGEYRTVRHAIEDLENTPAFTEIDSPAIELSAPPENLSELAKVLRGKLLYNHISTATRETAMERFKALKQGQNFHDLDANLKTTYSNAARTQNTIYMRLLYDEPSGTVVNVRKSMWVHPELDRAISIREAARLQTFPDSFIFVGSKDSQYQQVGNAVPPFLSYAIAESVLKVLDE